MTNYSRPKQTAIVLPRISSPNEGREMADIDTQILAKGFLRLPQILKIIPVSRSTWWSWVKSGRAPQGIKLGPRMTAWRLEDVHELVAEIVREGVR